MLNCCTQQNNKVLIRAMCLKGPNIKNKAISILTCNKIIILWLFFFMLSIIFYLNNFSIKQKNAIQSLHLFLNRSIRIIMDHYYKKNHNRFTGHLIPLYDY